MSVVHENMEFRGIQGNSGEFRGIQGNSGEFRGIQGNSGDTILVRPGKVV